MLFSESNFKVPMHGLSSAVKPCLKKKGRIEAFLSHRVLVQGLIFSTVKTREGKRKNRKEKKGKKKKEKNKKEKKENKEKSRKKREKQKEEEEV